ncbi:hypothetical protein, partial [Arthrobacter sp. M4]|uniref:hypothetical protein n=1 Tax=Arthrobacter sp. M4 TaxID=218160 RepID=UPI001CDB709A
PAISTNQKIGINKHGTLLSSQTTGTFELLSGIQFHFPVFIAAVFQAYFIRIHFANRRNSPNVHEPEWIPPFI